MSQSNPDAKSSDPEYDVIVIGSGASGGWVAKETAERGCKTLMLEAGRALDDAADFPDPEKTAGSRVSLLTRLKSTLFGQHVQARCMSFTPEFEINAIWPACAGALHVIYTRDGAFIRK